MRSRQAASLAALLNIHRDGVDPTFTRPDGPYVFLWVGDFRTKLPAARETLNNVATWP